ncbi:MAG TPA: toll/interleukin-1 receptor domain-containing protein [Gemmataceae bacterium]|jgi:hypothetical protein|nr:toll/interleukin-1 receptor domain-containing protein [Gemmataceae bacterium]
MLFISHSTNDQLIAQDILQWLRQQNYLDSQIFFDSDRESGIEAGADWKRALHDKLIDCSAVILLYSKNWRNSDWCPYELGHARALGKPIFPILIDENIKKIDDVAGMAKEYQAVWFHKDRKDALERLLKSLQAHHRPTDMFSWPHPKLGGDTCPYPGLPAFDERYAAVYFGREPEIKELLELLRKMRDVGEPRLLMVVGGSGSGKSSLLKAGVLPRLSAPDWVVLPTLRFGQTNEEHTLFAQLAQNLVDLFPRQPTALDWKMLRDRLANANVDEAARFLFETTQDLTMALDQKDATVVLPIDQFEEFLPSTDNLNASHFLHFLQAVFARKNGRLLAIGTMRSDYLDTYGKHRHAMTAPLFKSWHLAPFPHDRIQDVIKKPADRAHVKVEDALLAELVKDTPTAEALPLLAFTLEKLHRRYSVDGRLEFAEYCEMGGMEGALQKTIERILPEKIPAETLTGLRLSFVKNLAQVNEKDEVVRLTARWSDLPTAAQPLLEKFVDERLLVKGKDDQVEVAHEAIFRRWAMLKNWLRESGDIMRWRRDVRRQRASEGVKWAGLSTVQLAIARHWPTTRSAELKDEEKAWIHQGIRRQWLRRGAFVALFLLVAFLGAIAWLQKAESRENQRLARHNEMLKRALASRNDMESRLSLILIGRLTRDNPEASRHYAMKLLILQVLGQLISVTSDQVAWDDAKRNWALLEHQLRQDTFNDSWFEKYFFAKFQDDVLKLTVSRESTRENRRELLQIANYLKTFIGTDFSDPDIKKHLYAHAINVVGELTDACDHGRLLSSVSVFEELFWRLYLCEMVMVESPAVAARMVAVGSLLEQWEHSNNQKPSDELKSDLKKTFESLKDQCESETTPSP